MDDLEKEIGDIVSERLKEIPSVVFPEVQKVEITNFPAEKEDKPPVVNVSVPEIKVPEPKVTVNVAPPNVKVDAPDLSDSVRFGITEYKDVDA